MRVALWWEVHRLEGDRQLQEKSTLYQVAQWGNLCTLGSLHCHLTLLQHYEHPKCFQMKRRQTICLEAVLTTQQNQLRFYV